MVRSIAILVVVCPLLFYGQIAFSNPTRWAVNGHYYQLVTDADLNWTIA